MSGSAQVMVRSASCSLRKIRVMKEDEKKFAVLETKRGATVEEILP